MLFAGLMLVLSVFLAACTEKEKTGEGEKAPDKKDEGVGIEEITEVDPKEASLDFPHTVSNKEPVIEDGELTVGLVSESPFEGMLNSVFNSSESDARVMDFFDENLLSYDGDYLITNDGAATYEMSKDHKMITLKIKDNVNWHDGEPVKASDLLYSYELLGHPDYAGDFYDATISNVEGMPAYNEGKTDKISGINVIDDKNLTITFTEASPTILSGIWSTPTPRHHIGDVTTGEVTMEEIMSSGKIRVNPIGFGPYKVAEIIPGESVLYARNENYWRGKPSLKSVFLKVVNPSSVVELMKKGEIDYASIPADQYLNAKKLENVELLAGVESTYAYIGFNLGKWDEKKNENVMDPTKKMSNKLVRQAMWHAMDNETIGKELYHGLRIPANTAIPTAFASFHDGDNEGRPYDPEKARTLLTEAGYLDVNGDGFRETDKGEEFVLTFAAMEGGKKVEPNAKFYIQNWADVGIKVQLVDSRLYEYNEFHELLKADDSNVDIYQSTWGTGSDPDQEGLYGRRAALNYTHYTSEKNDELLIAGTSEQAFDTDYRRDIYNEWQALMIEDVPVAPTVYSYALLAVNNRVVNYSIDPGSELWLYEMGVSQEKSVVAK